MAIPFQAFTAPGVVQGSVAAAGRLGELLEAEPALRLEGVSLAPLDGSPAQQMPLGEVQVDDLLFVIAPTDTSTPMHAAWHALDLVLGPYAIHAELPTLPGFDPARALARPGGQFVLLGRVRLSLAVAPAAGEADIAFGWVNRYAVDAVSADIDLALFFPGARITVLAPASWLRTDRVDSISMDDTANDPGPTAGVVAEETATWWKPWRVTSR